jgi:hypothetical protein
VYAPKCQNTTVIRDLVNATHQQVDRAGELVGGMDKLKGALDANTVVLYVNAAVGASGGWGCTT